MEPVLKVHIPQYLRKGFAMKEIDFSVEKGYLTALVGVNGAGKTTLLSLLSGQLSLPEDAEVEIAGFSLRERGREAKNCLGFVFEDSPFDEGMSPVAVGEIFGRYYTEFDKHVYLDYLERFELPKKKPLGKLSKGMNLRFQLAFAMSHRAGLLLMDEPSASMDPVFREEFYTVLSEVLEKEECGILISTQLIAELEPLSDYMLLLHNGEQVYAGSTEELLEKFVLVRGRKELFPYMKSKILGTRQNEFFSEALIKRDNDEFRLDLQCVRPHAEDILYYLKAGIIRKEMFS